MVVESGSRDGRSGRLTRRALLGGGLAATLAGCNSTSLIAPGAEVAAPATPPPAAPGATVGETLGTGPVRVGMILPLTQNGAPSPLGVSMRNAAQLAMDEFSGPYITLMIADDRSAPDGAGQTAQAEIGAGAQLLLGPVYASDVRQAASVAKAAGKPIIGFSTDVSVASPGVYLLSFLIQSYVDRIAEFAASRGKRAFAADGAAERLRKPRRRSSSRRRPGGSTRRSSSRRATRRASRRRRRSRSRRPAPRSTRCSFPIRPRACRRSQALWPRRQSRRSFSARASGTTRACCGCPSCRAPGSRRPTTPASTRWRSATRPSSTAQPTRLATLSYDAVTLAGALARTAGPDPFSQQALTNVSGFNGADGVFRFRADGTNERGLAVMEIDNDAAVVISPAPRSFAGG